MIIRSIKLYNFGIYAGEQALFPSSTDIHSYRPVTLVGGFNGRGKTSLLEAVYLVLYGNRSQIVRERKQSYSSYLESLMHQGDTTASESWVEIEFDLYVGDEVVSLLVHRSWKQANVRIVDDLKVWVNGVSDSYVADNWSTYIEDLVPSAIAELFFFDGERISELAESEETTESLQKAIRSLLGIEIVDRLIKDLTLVSRKHQKRLKNDQIRAEVFALHEEHQITQLKVDQINQNLAGLSNRIIQTKKQQHELETEYFKSGGSLLESRDKLLSNRDKIRDRLSDLKAELHSFFAGPLPLLIVQNQLNAVQRTTQKERQIERAKSALPLLQNQYKELFEEMSDHNVQADVLIKMRRMMDQQIQSTSELAKQEPSIPMTYLGQAQLEDLISSSFGELRKRAIDLFRQYETVEYELEQVERHLLVDIDTTSASKHLENLAKVTAELTVQEKDQERLNKELATTKHKLESLENKIVRATTELGGVEEAKRIVQYSHQAQETYRIFREKIMKRKIDQLVESVTEAFNLLTHKTTFVNKVNIDPDNLRFTLWTSNGQEISKAKLSSGERQMLAVAILWGLGRVSDRKLPVIIDTPMGRLDSMHRMNFVQKYLPQASHQVIVLSTDTEIVNEYLETIRQYTGEEYLLEYNEQTRSTEIKSGYFVSVGEAR